MNNELYSNLTLELISKLDSFIDDNIPSTNVRDLSNYKILNSISNFEIIKKSHQPSFIYAGDFSNGYYYCIYYRHSNNNIYVINFYMQKFKEYYLLDIWNKKLDNDVSWVENLENDNKAYNN
jgi:hypothetical protein